MLIVPAPDRLVRDPETRRQVGAEGLDIDPTNLYWARLLRDGDVVEAPPATTKAPKAAPSEEPSA